MMPWLEKAEGSKTVRIGNLHGNVAPINGASQLQVIKVALHERMDA
ncbi:SirQ [Aspergillus luchuensis]|uniref:SirQ n=1 Tax=Aspergillus kawachii TaxID=1069201 RepID=A0A146FN39_ASPKA|nr:SirQ [Aspergillus luchuensis]